jgi:hypothetical protein
VALMGTMLLTMSLDMHVAAGSRVQRNKKR